MDSTKGSTTTKTAEVKITIPALSDYVAVARLAISGVAARMNFSIDEIDDLKVSVSEACNNVVQHAFPNGEGVICISCKIHLDHLEIIISDEGKGFDTTDIKSKKSDGVSEEESTTHFGLGLGLTFIKSLMDSSEVISIPGSGTTVRMTKNAPKLS